MLNICWMNKWMTVSLLPKNLQGLPFQTWTLFHSSAWLSSICTTNSLFSFRLLHFHSLSDKIPFTSSPFVKPSLPGLGPPSPRKLFYLMPTVHVCLQLLLSIIHLLLNYSPLPFQPHLSPVKVQWPWREALIHFSFCAPSPSQPLVRVSLPPAPSKEPFLEIMFFQNLYLHSVHSEFPSYITPDFRYWLFSSW